MNRILSHRNYIASDYEFLESYYSLCSNVYYRPWSSWSGEHIRRPCHSVPLTARYKEDDFKSWCGLVYFVLNHTDVSSLSVCNQSCLMCPYSLIWRGYDGGIISIVGTYNNIRCIWLCYVKWKPIIFLVWIIKIADFNYYYFYQSVSQWVS